jgi:hypothetical protein
MGWFVALVSFFRIFGSFENIFRVKFEVFSG